MGVELKLDWCSVQAARYAVEHWHYSRSLPTPPLVRVGVWENSIFVGCVIFGRGASPNLLKPYGLEQHEGSELVRIALAKHETPVTRIVAIALKMLRKRCPGLRLLISFADPAQGHHGGVYKGGGWIYVGKSSDSVEFIAPDGRRLHQRMVSKTGRGRVYGMERQVYRTEQCTKIICPGKHRYLMPLDNEMRGRVLKLVKEAPAKGEKEPLIVGARPSVVTAP
jgi:hypothetical protein